MVPKLLAELVVLEVEELDPDEGAASVFALVLLGNTLLVDGVSALNVVGLM